MINIGLESFRKTTNVPFWQTGFRPFFLLAAGYAVVVMFLWMGMYAFHWDLPLHQVSGMTWHGHEMVYGYVLAVVAGFLLTAVRNWTKLQTADGYLLRALVLFWLVGRIPPLTPVLAYFQAFGDVLFDLFFLIVIAAPIIHRKMHRQWPVLVILLALLMMNVTYYLGQFELLAVKPRQVLYISLYLVLNLVFIFTRRLIPNFINSALKPQEPLKNRVFLDKVLMPLFVLFSLDQVFFKADRIGLGLSVILFVLSLIRLKDWYRKGIWSRHLIWSLYMSYGLLVFGFLLHILAYYFGLSPFLPLHLFTIGGIGLVTISMMARVSFGHTGRNVLEEIQATKWLFWGMLGVVLFRVILPVFWPSLGVYFVEVAMVLWMLTFGLFFYRFVGILVRKRADGMYG